MADFVKLLGRRSEGSHFDGLFSQWGAIGSGLVVLVLATGTVRRVANSRAELVLGIGAALVTFLVTAIFGVLARQVHEAASRGELRTRRWEYLSYPAAIPLLVVGTWQLPGLGVTEAGMLLAVLLLLAACLATISLGILITLVSNKKGLG